MASPLNRRLFLTGSVGAAAALGLAACGGTGGGEPEAAEVDASSFAEGSTMAALAEAGKITIGTKFDQPLFGQAGPDGKPVGFDVEIGRAIAEHIGVEAEFVEGPWDGLIAGIDANRYDVVINQVGINEERQAKYDFSEPYIASKAALIVREDNADITTFEDLEGKRIGFSVSGFEDAMLASMLKHAGVDERSVQLINVNFALTPSLIGGQVDATIGGFRNFELTQMRLAGQEGRAFFPEEEGVPVYDELIFVTRQDLLEDTRLPRFLEAVERGALHLTNHPEESWELFIRAYPDLDDELNRQAWIDTLPRFAKRPFALDHRRYARFGAFMVESGLIEQAPAVEEIAVELE